MKRSVLALGGLLIILTISHSSLAQSSPPPPPPPRAGGVVEEINPEAWKKFESQEGRFVVSFPGKPKAQSMSYDVAGVKLKSSTHSVRSAIATYLASYFDLPQASDDPATAKALLDGARDKAVTNMKGKLKSEKEITLDGYPGRHTVVQFPESVLHARTYVVKNRIYQVTVVLPAFEGASAEGIELFNSFVNKFFDSFALAKETK